MIKILLTSDIHLGLNKDDFPVTEDMRINTFKKITSLAGKHDLFLIAGDLFDGFNVSSELVELVSMEFKNLASSNVEILYTPGESEIGENGKINKSILRRLNINHIFSDLNDLTPYTFFKDEQKICIYGFPATGKVDLSHLKRISDDGFHIGLFHVNFDLKGQFEDSKINSIQKNDIKHLNLDFYAMGHNHNFKLFKYHNQIIGAYPGSPEATSLNETGDRYTLSLMIKGNEIHQIKRLNVNSIKLKEIIIDCSNLNNDKNIADSIAENLSSKNILIIKLTGSRKFRIDQDILKRSGNESRDLIIQDHSIPEIELMIEEFQEEQSLRGEFFSVMNEKIIKGGLPSNLSRDELAYIINRILIEENYLPEEWLCR